MADVLVKVLEEPVSTNFLTLDEAKKMLGLATTGTPDPVADELLEIQIAQASAVIMRLCNRQFAKTAVSETWSDNPHAVTYLRLWPVEDDDVFYIGGDGVTIWPPPPDQSQPPPFKLENYSGKLYRGGDFTIGYWGGYLLPDDAPDDLKYACLMMLRTQRTEEARQSVEGIRMIAHKESRVIFFDPNAGGAKTSQAALSGSSGIPQVDALLEHYLRLWA